MRISKKTGLAISAGILTVGIFGAAGYTYFESNVPAAPARPSPTRSRRRTPRRWRLRRPTRRCPSR